MSSPPKIRFAAFEVDPVSGELRKHGVRVRLQDQPFKILLALLERPGEVVTRDDLRKRIWGDDTFVDFDHGLSAAVNRLREALGDSADKPRYIETLARRGYRFVGPVEPQAVPETAVTVLEAPHVSGSRKLVWVAAVAAAGLIVSVGLWLARKEGAAPPPARVVQLTSYTGMELDATFAPDGEQVAFAWDGENQDNFDIYVKMIGSATALRLTSDPAHDEYPAWSPDGRQIAFASSREQAGIYLVSPLGGAERKLADIRNTGGRLSWSPDGRFLAVATSVSERSGEVEKSALWLVPADASAQPRRILEPPEGTWCWNPAFSPVGRRLAITICSGVSPPAPVCQVHVVKLNSELQPEGKLEAIEHVQPPAVTTLLPWGTVWNPDGQSLIVSASVSAGSLAAPEPWLWRVAANPRGVPERVEVAGPQAAYPTIDSTGRRLAFTRHLTQTDIWRWEAGQKASAFVTSSLEDASPQFSRDGQRIAFGSRRGGDDVAIWVANRDGTGLAQITRGGSIYSGTPRWSPDGRRIAFDAMGKNGRWDIWLVQPNGSPARQLTNGPASNIIPAWSQDGEWVYFNSNRSGRHEIWRIPVGAGPAEQITRNGGHVAFPSHNGETLYFTKSEAGLEGLFTMPLTGGSETQLIKDPVISRGFSVFSDGIYYLASRDESSLRLNWMLAAPFGRVFHQLYKSNEIRFHEFATAHQRVIAQVEGSLGLGLTVSPDRKTFLFTKLIAASDLMLVENFH